MKKISVRIRNNKKNDPNLVLYTDAVNFFIDRLIGKRKNIINNNIVIYITINALIDEEGLCYFKITKKNHAVFQVKFKDGITVLEALITLAHECVHVKQFILGHLKVDDRMVWIWKGQRFGKDPYNTLTVPEIRKNIPWETEAYLKQKQLVREYFSSYLKRKT